MVLFAKVVISTLALLPFFVFIEKRLGQHWPTIQELLLLDARKHRICEHEECIRSCKHTYPNLKKNWQGSLLNLKHLKRMHFDRSSEKLPDHSEQNNLLRLTLTSNL